MCITGYSTMENPIHSTWKSKNSFPTSCKQRFPQLHKTASYTHYHNAYGYEIHLSYLSFIKMKPLKGGVAIKNVNTGYLIRAPCSCNFIHHLLLVVVT